MTEIGDSTENLPEYKTPPLNEVAAGFVFDPLAELLVPHIGSFWRQVQNKFPKVEHAPPLTNDDGSLWVDGMTGAPLPRVFFISEDQHELVQLQNDRLFFNWRQTTQPTPYPRYSRVKDGLQYAHKELSQFASEQFGVEIVAKQLELTYVNVIPLDTGQGLAGDLSGIFSDFLWSNRAGRFLPKPLLNNWTTVFRLPNGQGQLTARVMTAKRVVDQVDVVRFELSVKELVSGPAMLAMWQWFDLAHEWIVRGFADLTNAEAQRNFWGRTR